MEVKAVLFDLGGTLVKTSPVPEVVKNILEIFGVKRTTKQIEHARKTVERTVSFEKLPILEEQFWVRWNAKVLEQLGVHNNIQLLAHKITELWWQYSEIELYPDAEETLMLLKQSGLKLGLITNGLKSDIREILQKVGLTRFFDVEIASNTIGKMKPNKEVFLHALKTLDLLPNEALFVGDMIDTDYRGAKACGLKALLINRENNVKEKDVERIGSLTEILECV